MSLADIERADRRLLILRALAADNNYSINNYVLAGLLSEYGHRVSTDTMATDLAWLAEQGLITLEPAGPAMQVATITQRGFDVATGAAVVPGIRRPRPGE